MRSSSLRSNDGGAERSRLLRISSTVSPTALALPVLHWLFKHAFAEKIGVILLSALAAHTAWHWMTERYATFRRYDVQWPELTADVLVVWLRYAMAGVVLAGVLYAVNAFVVSRRTPPPPAA